MKNPFRHAGFRDAVIKGAISVALVVLAQKLVQWFLVSTPLFKQYLDIPGAFQIGKGIISISITNALIFGVVVFAILTFERLLVIKKFRYRLSSLWFAPLALIFFVLHYYLKYVINQNIDFFLQAPLLWAILKIFIQLLFVASVFLAIYGVEFARYFFGKFKKEILITLATTIVFFILMMIMQNLWTFFSSAISHIIYLIFSIFFDHVTYTQFVPSFGMAEGGGPLLGINNFRAIVGKSCSGIDSFLLFTSLFALIFILDRKRLKTTSTVIAYAIGIVGMFFTNILRIMLLFIVGAYINAEFAIGLFHTNVGWILFIVYFFVYWQISSRFVYKKK